MSLDSVSISDLSSALENGEFIFFFQPKISMLSGAICGAEALIRWRHPDGTYVMPGDFLPYAEETGFISEITKGTLPKLLSDIAKVHAVNPSTRVAFNTSTKDFETPNLAESVIKHVSEHNDARNIEVEITEASLLSDDSSVRENLYSLPEAGIPLAMDDFTDGFSNINRLTTLPFSTLKLDQKIVQKVCESLKDASIVQTSIRMAHKLGLEIVAEGVENWHTYHFLLNAGCTQSQGFWISKPLPLPEFLDLLNAKPRWPALPVGLLHMVELDYIEWRKALQDMVFFLEHQDAKEIGKPALKHLPELDHTKSGLGKWYYGAGKHFADYGDYIALEAPHKRVHEIGRRLMKAALDKQSKDVIDKYMQNINEESTRIILLLQNLQYKAVSDLGDLDSAKVDWHDTRHLTTVTMPVLTAKELAEKYGQK